MSLIEWPEFTYAEQTPDITNARSMLEYAFNLAYLGTFDAAQSMQAYLDYGWSANNTNIVYLGSGYAPLTNTGTVKFTNTNNGSGFTVTAKATGAYFSPGFYPSPETLGRGEASLTINFVGKNSANRTRQTLDETVNTSFTHNVGYTEDANSSSTLFKDGLDTASKLDDVVLKLASSNYDLSKQVHTTTRDTYTEKHTDTLDALYNKAAGTAQEVYQSLKISNEYAKTEIGNTNGSSSVVESVSEVSSIVNRDVQNRTFDTKDVSHRYSLDEAISADGDTVSSETEGTSFKAAYGDQNVINAVLSHTVSSVEKSNDNLGIQQSSASETLDVAYADVALRKLTISLDESTDEITHDSGNSDKTSEVYDLSKFNYSDAVNSFTFSFKEINISGTTANGDEKDDVYKLSVDADIKTADYSITTKEFTHNDLNAFSTDDLGALYDNARQIKDYADLYKEEELPNQDDIESLFADFELAVKDIALLGDNTIKVFSLAGLQVDAGRGDDTVLGNIGRDILAGGAGKDILTGGRGADIFVFNSALDAKTNVDVVKDFSAAEGDQLLLDTSVFTGSQAFHLSRLASQAAITNNTIAGVIYDSTSGKLYYNADGLVDHTVQFATLTAHPLLDQVNVSFLPVL